MGRTQKETVVERRKRGKNRGKLKKTKIVCAISVTVGRGCYEKLVQRARSSWKPALKGNSDGAENAVGNNILSCS